MRHSNKSNKPHSSQKSGGQKKRNFRNFHDRKPAPRQNLQAGDSFIFQDSFRPRKSFPFLTPGQALAKHIHIPEKKVRPLEK